LLFAKISFCKGQINLVPNPSFESYTACPNNAATISFATGWLNFGQTPDYFNSCANSTASFVGVLSNYFGYHTNIYSKLYK